MIFRFSKASKFGRFCKIFKDSNDLRAFQRIFEAFFRDLYHLFGLTPGIFEISEDFMILFGISNSL